MANSVILDYDAPELKNKVYCKTNIGGWFFDAYLNMSHVSRLRITDHPVQTGANIADHSFLEPKELTMELGCSDVATSIIPGQFTGGWSRSVKAFEILKDLQAQRVPIQILTRLGGYKNMLIETLSAPDDYKTIFGLRATVTFKEVLVATTRTIKVSARPKITDSVNKGKVEPVVPKANETILYQGAKGLGVL